MDTAALLIAGGSLLSGLIGSKATSAAAGKEAESSAAAAKISADAYDRATQASLQGTQDALRVQLATYLQSRQDLAPQRAAGQAALAKLLGYDNAGQIFPQADTNYLAAAFPASVGPMAANTLPAPQGPQSVKTTPSFPGAPAQQTAAQAAAGVPANYTFQMPDGRWSDPMGGIFDPRRDGGPQAAVSQYAMPVRNGSEGQPEIRAAVQPQSTMVDPATLQKTKDRSAYILPDGTTTPKAAYNDAWAAAHPELFGGQPAQRQAAVGTDIHATDENGNPLGQASNAGDSPAPVYNPATDYPGWSDPQVQARQAALAQYQGNGQPGDAGFTPGAAAPAAPSNTLINAVRSLMPGASLGDVMNWLENNTNGFVRGDASQVGLSSPTAPAGTGAGAPTGGSVMTATRGPDGSYSVPGTGTAPASVGPTNSLAALSASAPTASATDATPQGEFFAPRTFTPDAEFTTERAFYPGDDFTKPITISQADLEADPSYQFRKSEAQKAAQRTAAAAGYSASGRELKAAENVASNLASTEYQNVYNRTANDLARRYGIAAATYDTETNDLARRYGISLDTFNAGNADVANRFNRLASIAGVGQQANSQLATAAQGTGAGTASLYAQQGSTLANIAQNQGNTLAQITQQQGANAANAGLGQASILSNAATGGIQNYLAYRQNQDFTNAIRKS